MSSPRDVVLLGSTGSIGTQAIEVIQQHPDRFRVTALSAGGRNLDLLAAQAVALRVDTVGVATGQPDDVRSALEQAAGEQGVHGYAPEVVVGPEANTRLAGLGADVVLNGITGSIGLQPTLAALAAGSSLALANKESLIVGGAAGQAAAAPGQIVPVDSEHSAIAQCLRGRHHRGGTPPRGHRQRWSLPRPEPGGPRARSPSPRPWPTPTSRWARSSRPTPRRWSTRGSR